jgi:predicted transcriptional regulator
LPESELGSQLVAIYGNLLFVQKTTLYIPTDLQRSLAAIAKREGRSQADIVRSALAAYLSARDAVPFRSIGSGTDDEVSGASSEDWLRKNWKTSSRKRRTRR